jgi:predicted Kef-type K+ transport protein
MTAAAAVLAVVVAVVVPAVLAGRIAQRKGRPFWLYLIAGLLVGPVALLAAIVLPRRSRLI